MFTIALFDELDQNAMLYEAGVHSNLGPTGVTKHWRHNKRKPICRVAHFTASLLDNIVTKVYLHSVYTEITQDKTMQHPSSKKLSWLLSPFAS